MSAAGAGAGAPSMRPEVVINVAMSADGKIAPADRAPGRMTSREDRRRLALRRAEADVLVMGAATLREVDPPVDVRGEAAARARLAAGRTRALDVVVVSGSLQLPLTARFFAPGPGLRAVATVDGADASALAAAPQIEIWRLGAARVAMDALLARLARAGARRVLVEGGGEICWHWVAADLVDVCYVTIAPCLLGGRAAPTWVGGAGHALAAAPRLRLVAAEAHGDEIFCEWRRRR